MKLNKFLLENSLKTDLLILFFKNFIFSKIILTSPCMFCESIINNLVESKILVVQIILESNGKKWYNN